MIVLSEALNSDSLLVEIAVQSQEYGQLGCIAGDMRFGFVERI